MTIFVQENLKNEVIQDVIRHNPYLSLLSGGTKWAFTASCALAGIYAGMNYLIPGLSVVIISGIPQKDTLTIISHTILILIFGIVCNLCFKTLLANRVSKDLTERTCESITFDGYKLTYLYRLYYQTTPESRLLVYIPLENINSVDRNFLTRKITFKGFFFSAYAENYTTDEQYYPVSGTMNSFVIYDYFEPALTSILQEQGWIPMLPPKEVKPE